MLQDRVFAIAQIADQAVLYILLILSILSLAFILERFFVLQKISAESNKVRSRVKALLQSQSLEDIEKLERNPETLSGRALSFAVKYVKAKGDVGFEEAFNAFILSERPDLERSLNFLATIGSNAPYIGLLGTVLGIMKAFQDLALNAEAGQQTVMAGISLALVSTAAGLAVAIPAVVCYNYFNKKVKSIIQGLDTIREVTLAYAKGKARLVGKYTDHEEPISGINVVPLVDIVLVVLIIFMVTAPMLMKPSIQVNLPKAATGESTEKTKLNFTIQKTGEVMLNGQPASDDVVKQRATEEASKGGDVEAIIAADRDTPHGDVVHLLDLVKSAGIKNSASASTKNSL